MNPVFRNIIAVISGIVLGSIANMGIVMISGSIIPPPEGVDPTSMESLKSTMHLFEARHFVMPFCAHAFGTLSGAFLCSLIAASHKLSFGFLTGLFFLFGGIANIFMLPSPAWFAVLDLVGAYMPMAWLGGRLAGRIVRS